VCYSRGDERSAGLKFCGYDPAAYCRRRRRASALRALPVVIALIGTAAAAQPADTSVKAVLASADAYLLDYQKKLTFLLADESSTQQAVTRSRVTEQRHTSGELFVTFVPADRALVAVHDVARVDGVPVDGHEDIRRLLARSSVAGVARQLVNRNARFNIGRVVRNFNEPTLGLLVLDAGRRSQLRFERKPIEPGGDASTVTLGFRETDSPTLVRYEGMPVYATGEISIDVATGRIRRTFVDLTILGLHAQLTTIYSHDPNLDLWLPATFTERYEAGPNARDVVKCVSTYTNWRRFAATSSFRPASP
jgi:hypothetical protein